MTILTYDEGRCISQLCKQNSSGRTQNCLTITHAKLYEAVSLKVPNEVVDAQMLTTMELEAKVLLDALD